MAIKEYEKRRIRFFVSSQTVRRQRDDTPLAFLFFLPMAIFLLWFIYLPATMSLILGFYHYHLLGVNTTFAGFANFADALTYPVFWIAFKNTLLYAAYMVPLTLVGAVGIALLIDQKSHWYGMIRTFVLLPYITPVIATAIGWLWMFNPQYGILNAILRGLHLPQSQWLLSPAMAMPSVALYSLWHGLGFNVVIVLSALGNMPRQLLEAAALDGATKWQQFRYIILPLLSPTLYFLLIVTTIGTFQAFAPIYALSGGQGGPEYATTTLLLLIYQTAFQDFHFSYAAAMAMLLVVIIFTLTLIQHQMAKRWVFYQ
ncbi:MAG: sugar ABC transporter permease [Sulfobacillus thermosulfidooxidans]|uniref:Sugar ABC transporter permease n=1 Tax=Sulfobacillus thermosulfidooxidans TaxID=28034 RepID=A0A2T2WTR9_SULTH|nr:MAG: sugar ABC transporter permease [Sulfobacillus thermosulfidooxidans]